MGLNFDSIQVNKKLRDALMNAQNTDELNEVFLKARSERIARPGEQLELFPTVWKRTQEQEEAAADVLRWAETYGVYVPDGCDALMDRARRYADSHAKMLRAMIFRTRDGWRTGAQVRAGGGARYREQSKSRATRNGGGRFGALERLISRADLADNWESDSRRRKLTYRGKATPFLRRTVKKMRKLGFQIPLALREMMT